MNTRAGMVAVAMLAAAGCDGRALPMMSKCSYSFTAPNMTPIDDGTTACAMESDGHSFMLVLGTADPVYLTVISPDKDGYARLENGNSGKPVVGAVYGLSDLEFSGCNNWGGHVKWSLSNGSVEIIATCARPSAAPMHFNATVSLVN